MNSETIYDRRIWWIAQMLTVNEYRWKKQYRRTHYLRKIQDENRLGREITPTKHGKLCFPEILKPSKHPSFEMNSKWQQNTTQPYAAVDCSRATVVTSHNSRTNTTGKWAKSMAVCTICQAKLFPCFTTGGISVLIDMNVAHNVFFRGFSNTTRSRFESSTVLCCYASKGISLQMFRHNLSVLPYSLFSLFLDPRRWDRLSRIVGTELPPPAAQ